MSGTAGRSCKSKILLRVVAILGQVLAKYLLATTGSRPTCHVGTGTGTCYSTERSIGCLPFLLQHVLVAGRRKYQNFESDKNTRPVQKPTTKITGWKIFHDTSTAACVVVHQRTPRSNNCESKKTTSAKQINAP